MAIERRPALSGNSPLMSLATAVDSRTRGRRSGRLSRRAGKGPREFLDVIDVERRASRVGGVEGGISDLLAKLCQQPLVSLVHGRPESQHYRRVRSVWLGPCDRLAQSAEATAPVLPLRPFVGPR